MNYYKRDWNETTGNEFTDPWGTSTYYFETDDAGSVTRQIEIYNSGTTLWYDRKHEEDKFGGLSQAPIDLEEFEPYAIAADEFEHLWSFINYKKYPGIVITDDVMWGQPRIDGRRLSVGDIVSYVDINRSAYIAADDYEITLHQVKQALLYCSELQCVKERPSKYCYNCTLRVHQDREVYGEEKDNWITAEKLLTEFFS